MQFFLNQHANVVVFPATPNVELVYAISKAILAPSLWPEAFGLVALEASLRGIPAITSDSAGLREANPVPAHVVRTPLVFDVNAQQLLRRASQDGALLGKPGGYNDAELDKGTTPGFSSMIAFFARQFKMSEGEVKGILAVADGREIDGYSAHVAAFGDAGQLRAKSDAAYEAARSYVAGRRHAFRDLLRSDAKKRRAGRPAPAARAPPIVVPERVVEAAAAAPAAEAPPPAPPPPVAPPPPEAPPPKPASPPKPAPPPKQAPPPKPASPKPASPKLAASPKPAPGGAKHGSFRAFLEQQKAAQ